MKVLIAGAGRLGTRIAQVLSAARNDVTLVENDEGRLAELGDLPHVRVVVGDACEPALLEHAGVLACDLVIATGVGRVAARVNEEENAWLFDQRWGVDVAVPGATPLISLIARDSAPRVFRLDQAGSGSGVWCR
ncbi:potassium channel family protein, partial [Streptomyces misionensis]|uniref:potassium channel family protein n=1 Tax=Streptomyces misionensis TaxID=67331 RepID=UPI0033DECFE3